MKDMQKKRILLFLFFFALTFCIYLATLSDNLSYQSDYIQIPISVEELSPGAMRPLFHILWYPLGKSVYGFFKGLGYSGRSLKPIELLNAVLASTGSALFALLLFNITGDLIISICLAALLSFSYPLWQEFTHTKLYSGGFLFTVLCFHMFTRENLRQRPLLFALVNTAAFLFHVSNIFLMPATCLYLLLLPGRMTGKALTVLKFLSITAVFTVIGYLLIFRLTGESLDFSTFMPSLVSYYESTWMNYCRFSFLFSAGLDPDRADLSCDWPLLIGPVVYSAMLLILIFSRAGKLRRSQLFIPSIFFAIAMVAGGVMTSQRNPNIYLTLIPLNVIFALAVSEFSSSSVWRRALTAFLIIYSAAMLIGNFRTFSSMTGRESDFIYQGVISEPGSIISSDDLIVANSSIPYYFTYYRKSLAYDIDARFQQNAVDELISELRREMRGGKELKLVVDSYPVHRNALIRPLGVPEPQSVVDLFGGDFSVKPLFRSSNGRFHVFSVEMTRYISITGVLRFSDRKGPSLSRRHDGSGKPVDLYFYEGLRAVVTAEARRRIFQVPVTADGSLLLTIPMRGSAAKLVIDRIALTRKGYETRNFDNVPVVNDTIPLGTVILHAKAR
jgi:hypothetical protein